MSTKYQRKQRIFSFDQCSCCWCLHFVCGQILYKLWASLCCELKTESLVKYKTRACSPFSVCVSIGVKQPMMYQKIRGGTQGSQSHFKGKSFLPFHRLALPYLTASLPGCELRCLVSILNHKPKGRKPVWLSVYVWACFLFVCVSISPLLPSL